VSEVRAKFIKPVYVCSLLSAVLLSIGLVSYVYTNKLIENDEENSGILRINDRSIREFQSGLDYYQGMESGFESLSAEKINYETVSFSATLSGAQVMNMDKFLFSLYKKDEFFHLNKLSISEVVMNDQENTGLLLTIDGRRHVFSGDVK